jgi:hypothetical protein
LTKKEIAKLEDTLAAKAADIQSKYEHFMQASQQY